MAGRLVLRSVVGGLMAGHGLQKLNGSFGGHGIDGTAKGFEAMGMYPPRAQAYAAALSETVGGGLTAAGLLNPIGPSMIIGTMAVAIKKVHGQNGVWVTKGGFEYNLVLIAAALAAATEGPGPLSLDALRGKQKGGTLAGLVALGMGVGAAFAAMAVSDRFAPPAADPSLDPTTPSEASDEAPPGN